MNVAVKYPTSLVSLCCERVRQEAVFNESLAKFMSLDEVARGWDEFVSGQWEVSGWLGECVGLNYHKFSPTWHRQIKRAE